jgi:hypothetical protein
MKLPTHKARVRQAPPTGEPFACLTHAFFPTLTMALIMSINTFGQIPVVETPKAATLSPVITGNFNPNSNLPPSTFLQGMTEVERSNQQTIRSIEEHQRYNSFQQIQQLYAEMDRRTISYTLPELNALNGTELFRNALAELNKMLSGKKPLDLKRAVFVVENAYFENQLDYGQFESAVQQAVDICNLKLAETNSNASKDLLKNLTILKYFTDTINVKLPGQEKTLTHYPIKYDFNDYMGQKNWSNMFVSKLMATNSGQCHSMPLFYLILAQELKAEAYLAFSPNHSFIKFKTERGGWYNAELTSGSIISDAAILESGFVKSEAIRSGIYMDTLSRKETVASLINTLANGYVHKYGYDSFVKQCAEIVLQYYPKQLNALMLLANWQTTTTMYIARQKGSPPPEKLKEDERARMELERMHHIYARIDALGFEPMPEEHYLKWLEKLNEAKFKPENQKSIIHQIIK